MGRAGAGEVREALTAYGVPSTSYIDGRTLPSNSYATLGSQATILAGLETIALGQAEIIQYVDCLPDVWVPVSTPPTPGEISEQVASDLTAAHGEGPWTTAGITVVVASTSLALQAVDTDGNLTIHRGDTFSFQLTALGDLSNVTKYWFTIKARRTDIDEAAKVQITQAGGLVRFLGLPAPDSSQGSLTVNDVAAGVVTIQLQESMTAQLPRTGSWVFDLQVLRSNGNVETLSDGSVVVQEDVTRATS